VRDLHGIHAYIDRFNPHAAGKILERLEAVGNSLGEMPERGRLTNGDRELTLVRPYILRYRVTPDRVVILRVRHGARKR